MDNKQLKVCNARLTEKLSSITVQHDKAMTAVIAEYNSKIKALEKALENESEIEDSISLVDQQEEISIPPKEEDKLVLPEKALIIGGHSNLVRKILEDNPNWVHADFGQTLSAVEGRYDAIILPFNYMSHKINSYVETRCPTVPKIYINSTNRTLVYREISEAWRKQVFADCG